MNYYRESYEVMERTSSSSFTGSAAFTEFESCFIDDLQSNQNNSLWIIQQKKKEKNNASPDIYNKIILTSMVVTHSDSSAVGQLLVPFKEPDFPAWS